jgi:hypothetical protein
MKILLAGALLALGVGLFGQTEYDAAAAYAVWLIYTVLA